MCCRSRDIENIDFSDASWEEMGDDGEAGSKTNLVFQTNKQRAIDDLKCIAFEESLRKLLEWAVGDSCSQSDEPVTFTTRMYATCMMISWRSSYREKLLHGHWSSQPNLIGMKAGNLLLPACLALAGNSYTALFAKFLKLAHTHTHAHTHMHARPYTVQSAMSYGKTNSTTKYYIFYSYE